MSILLVLAGHLLPLGPSSWALNFMSAAAGMALFFTLSGFLITQFLLASPHVGQFIVRRLFRIVPLAWAAMAVLVVADRASAEAAAANFLFFTNLEPTTLLLGGEHLWSLCVEVQFYLGIALLVAVAGRRGLYALPMIALAFTALKIFAGEFASIATPYRVDEILAGAVLALLHHRLRTQPLSVRVPPWSVPLLFFGLLVSAHQGSGAFGFARPYLAAAVVGVSIVAAPVWLSAILCSRAARYVAEVSYAVYVVHGMLSVTWLGIGDTVAKYAKRPLLFLAVFVVAHLSTFYFERPMTSLGRRLSSRMAQVPRTVSAA